MKRRKWDAKTKAAIVVQGLKGKPVAELCTEHQISQAQYYQRFGGVGACGPTSGLPRGSS